MRPVDPETLKKLREGADRARRTHYAPYSKFMVLASVEATNGTVYGGSNVEIINYSLSKHAEEVAVLAGILAGQKPKTKWIRAVYVAGASPCGSCRQFIAEFAAGNALCIFERISQGHLRSRRSITAAAKADNLDPPREWKLSELLPEAFGSEAGL